MGSYLFFKKASCSITSYIHLKKVVKKYDTVDLQYDMLRICIVFVF